MNLFKRNIVIQLILLIFISFSCISCLEQTTESSELQELELELEAKESILAQIEADIERMVNNAPSCAKGTAEVIVDEGPISELRDEIAMLRDKIASLEK